MISTFEHAGTCAKFQRLLRSPLFWILALAALYRIPGLFWGLPGSDGWDTDGVAPRNFLVGLAQTYAPGQHFTYPPLHMLLLALLTWPGWALALAKAHSLSSHDVIGEMIRVPIMTFFSVTARLVSAAVSLGTIYIVARMAELVGGRRAGWFAAAACAINAGFTFYSQVSNLDGPYLFWTSLSLLAWMRLIAEHDLRQLRYGTLAAAAAVATKDQAYAVFILAVPAVLALWFALDRWAQQNVRRIFSLLLAWGGLSLFLLLLIDGAITNPTGFAGRLAFLTGPATRDYVEYTRDWAGRIRLVEDMATFFVRPAAFALLAGFGIVLCAARVRRDAPASIAALVPILAAVSFTLAFNFVALRSEVRFLLPQALLVAVYAGLAAEWLASLPPPVLRSLGALYLLFVFLGGLYACTGIAAAMVNDPRYDTERWLQAHAAHGASVETYGLNAYLPRFPDGTLVTRLDTKPAKRRSPLPDVTELDQPFDALPMRHPRFIVVSGFWVRRYLDDSQPAAGRVFQLASRSVREQARTQEYFRVLLAGKLGYRIVHRSAYDPGFWPATDDYAGVGQTVYVLERR